MGWYAIIAMPPDTAMFSLLCSGYCRCVRTYKRGTQPNCCCMDVLIAHVLGDVYQEGGSDRGMGGITGNPSTLLHLFLKYDRLDEAVDLVSEYLDEIETSGSFDIIEATGHACEPQHCKLWFPHQGILLLRAKIQQAGKSALLELLDERLEAYYGMVQNCSRDLLFMACGRE